MLFPVILFHFYLFSFYFFLFLSVWWSGSVEGTENFRSFCVAFFFLCVFLCCCNCVCALKKKSVLLG